MALLLGDMLLAAAAAELKSAHDRTISHSCQLGSAMNSAAMLRKMPRYAATSVRIRSAAVFAIVGTCFKLSDRGELFAHFPAPEGLPPSPLPSAHRFENKIPHFNYATHGVSEPLRRSWVRYIHQGQSYSLSCE